MDDDEEANFSKGPAFVCDLSVASVHQAVSLAEKHIASKRESYLSNLAVESARQAVNLTKLGATAEISGTTAVGAIFRRHVEVPPPPKLSAEVRDEA